MDEVSPLWLTLLGIFLLVQGTWIFQDARKRGRFPWLWGLWGITGFPTPLIIYWFVVIRLQRKPGARNLK
ncbi:hypothetical protein BK141_16025 [Paenibacillus sp. FSL R5-0765]|nr:hypothetical protein BK141_16025 [Paenibacillus sp. FSL R5-0765]